MNTTIIRIFLLAPFALLFLAAFVVALMVEWAGDLLRGSAPMEKAP